MRANRVRSARYVARHPVSVDEHADDGSSRARHANERSVSAS